MDVSSAQMVTASRFKQARTFMEKEGGPGDDCSKKNPSMRVQAAKSGNKRENRNIFTRKGCHIQGLETGMRGRGEGKEPLTATVRMLARAKQCKGHIHSRKKKSHGHRSTRRRKIGQ